MDFAQGRRFKLSYTNKDNQPDVPLIIHRAPLGTHERFIGFLLEHYAGKFPTWLAPVQVRAIPVAEAFVPYLDEIVRKMKALGIRAEIDDSDDRMQKKIRNAQTEKIPFMVIAGGEDQDAGAVSFRYRNGEQRNGISVAAAIDEITEAINTRKQV